MRGVTRCFILCLLIFALLAGCLAPSSPPEELTAHSWRLVSFNNGNELADIGPLTIITLRFGEDGRLGGNAGCNEYFGDYQLEGGLMSVRGVGATEKHCVIPEGVMDMEQTYLRLLSNTTRYHIDQDELTLSYFDEKKLLVFRKQ